MSSLAATQADGYYLPPEYFESGQYKQKSKNQYADSKGHNQFVKNGVLRFELPYKGVCQGTCQTSISRGTRYNAKKIKNGAYFSTPIWEFQMKCRKCQHPWIIRTNPKERGFDYVSGVTIQHGQQDTSHGIVDFVVEGGSEPNHEASPPITQSSSSDAVVGVPINSLSSEVNTAHSHRDESRQNASSTIEGQAEAGDSTGFAKGTKAAKIMTDLDALKKLKNLNTKTTLMDAEGNKRIRDGFRVDRKQKRKRLTDASKKGWRKGMELLESNTSDTLLAKEAVYGNSKQAESKRLAQVRQSSIFSKAGSSSKRQKRHSAKSKKLKKRHPLPDGQPSSVLSMKDSDKRSVPAASDKRKTKAKKRQPSHKSGVSKSATKSARQSNTSSILSHVLDGYGSDGSTA